MMSPFSTFQVRLCLLAVQLVLLCTPLSGMPFDHYENQVAYQTPQGRSQFDSSYKFGQPAEQPYDTNEVDQTVNSRQRRNNAANPEPGSNYDCGFISHECVGPACYNLGESIGDGFTAPRVDGYYRRLPLKRTDSLISSKIGTGTLDKLGGANLIRKRIPRDNRRAMGTLQDFGTVSDFSSSFGNGIDNSVENSDSNEDFGDVFKLSLVKKGLFSFPTVKPNFDLSLKSKDNPFGPASKTGLFKDYNSPLHVTQRSNTIDNFDLNRGFGDAFKLSLSKKGLFSFTTPKPNFDPNFKSKDNPFGPASKTGLFKEYNSPLHVNQPQIIKTPEPGFLDFLNLGGIFNFGKSSSGKRSNIGVNEHKNRKSESGKRNVVFGSIKSENQNKGSESSVIGKMTGSFEPEVVIEFPKSGAAVGRFGDSVEIGFLHAEPDLEPSESSLWRVDEANALENPFMNQNKNENEENEYYSDGDMVSRRGYLDSLGGSNLQKRGSIERPGVQNLQKRGYLDSLGGQNLQKKSYLDSLGGQNLQKRSYLDSLGGQNLQKRSYLDSLGGQNLQRRSYLDSLGGQNLQRRSYLDSLGGQNLQRRSYLDSLGGQNLQRRSYLDSLGGQNLQRRSNLNNRSVGQNSERKGTLDMLGGQNLQKRYLKMLESRHWPKRSGLNILGGSGSSLFDILSNASRGELSDPHNTFDEIIYVSQSGKRGGFESSNSSSLTVGSPTGKVDGALTRVEVIDESKPGASSGARKQSDYFKVNFNESNEPVRFAETSTSQNLDSLGGTNLIRGLDELQTLRSVKRGR